MPISAGISLANLLGNSTPVLGPLDPRFELPIWGGSSGIVWDGAKL